MDLLSAVPEENLAAARHLHEPCALSSHRLLDHAREPTGACVLELDVALVGDHRTKLRLNRRGGQLDLQELGVLQRERLARLRLLEPLQRLFDRHIRLLEASWLAGYLFAAVPSAPAWQSVRCAIASRNAPCVSCMC